MIRSLPLPVPKRWPATSCVSEFLCLDSLERERGMSPTIFRELGFRFFFFSREESRMHVHVYCAHGEAKFWIEPSIELEENYGLRGPDLQTARRLIEEHEDEIRDAWQRHFGS